MVGFGCPECDMTEWWGADEPRHRFNILELQEWLETDVDENEKSINKCCVCNTTFEVEWDYDNLYTEQ